MRLKYTKCAILFLICLTCNSIVHGQISSTDSVTISRDQQRQCIIWYKELGFKDSIIVSKESIIEIQANFIDSTEQTLTELDNDLQKANKKLVRMRKKRNRAWFIGGGVAGILTILLLVR